jgi:hypothetical protein
MPSTLKALHKTSEEILQYLFVSKTTIGHLLVRKVALVEVYGRMNVLIVRVKIK